MPDDEPATDAPSASSEPDADSAARRAIEAYREAIGDNLRTAYDLLKDAEGFEGEIAVLRAVVAELTKNTEQNSRAIAGIIGTLCRVVTTRDRTGSGSAATEEALLDEGELAIKGLHKPEFYQPSLLTGEN